MGASSPGPSLIVILRHAVADGRSAGINAAVGHGLGIFIYALVSAIGLSFILILVVDRLSNTPGRAIKKRLIKFWGI